MVIAVDNTFLFLLLQAYISTDALFLYPKEVGLERRYNLTLTKKPTEDKIKLEQHTVECRDSYGVFLPLNKMESVN